MTPCAIPECDKPAKARGWCQKHYKRWQVHGTTDEPCLAKPELPRFMAYVDAPHGMSGCWLWTGSRHPQGYGQFRTHRDGMVRAHRWAYERFVRPIPAGLEIDHLCHTHDLTCPGGDTCPHRACCNPAHLEAIPPSLNKIRGRGIPALNRRKTHCKYGHEFTPENTYSRSKGNARHCRTCAIEASRRTRQRKKDELANAANGIRRARRDANQPRFPVADLLPEDPLLQRHPTMRMPDSAA